MKRLLTCVAGFLWCIAASAQGTVNFNNSPGALGGNGAPIYDVDGVTPLSGTGFLAQLFAGPDAGSLQPWGAALNFRTGAGAGFFDTRGVDTSRTIGSVVPGGAAIIQVRVWEYHWIDHWQGGGFNSAAELGFRYGASAVFTVVTGGAGSPPSLPANLVGLTSFSLVPEPAAWALLALGAALMGIRRRG
jgi:hypothetical protein